MNEKLMKELDMLWGLSILYAIIFSKEVSNQTNIFSQNLLNIALVGGLILLLLIILFHKSKNLGLISGYLSFLSYTFFYKPTILLKIAFAIIPLLTIIRIFEVIYEKKSNTT